VQNTHAGANQKKNWWLFFSRARTRSLLLYPRYTGRPVGNPSPRTTQTTGPHLQHTFCPAFFEAKNLCDAGTHTLWAGNKPSSSHFLSKSQRFSCRQTVYSTGRLRSAVWLFLFRHILDQGRVHPCGVRLWAMEWRALPDTHGRWPAREWNKSYLAFMRLRFLAPARRAAAGRCCCCGCYRALFPLSRFPPTGIAFTCWCSAHVQLPTPFSLPSPRSCPPSPLVSTSPPLASHSRGKKQQQRRHWKRGGTHQRSSEISN